MAPIATATPYRHYIQPEADAEFPAEAGRYHLYVTYSCPFACRALAARNLKGLQDVISISIAHPILKKTKPNDDSDTHLGWTFVDPEAVPTIQGVNGIEYSTAGATPDTINNVKFVRDLYELVVPKEDGRRYTVPLLWDKKNKKIVSNESADILRTFNTGFRDLVPSNVDLLPEALKDEVEAMNTGVVESIGSGVFKVLLAKNEEIRVEELAKHFANIQTADGILAKDEEIRVEELAKHFANIQTADGILAKSRYLVGTGITEADVRLFHWLIRVDVHQRESDKFQLTQYPNVVGYLRDLYQTPALKATVNWEHLKLMLVNVNPNIVAPGPFVDYDAAHDRATRFTD